MTKNTTTKIIAEALDAELIGDASISITRVVHPSEATSAQDLVLAMDAALLPLLAGTPARAVIVAANMEIPADFATTRIVVKRPRVALAKITNLFAQDLPTYHGVHPTAIIEDGVQLGANVSVGAYSYIGSGSKIGANTIIHPQSYIGPDVVLGEGALIHSGVRIGARVQIGTHVIIHFNASIGADGFSFVTPQLGSVEAAKASSGGTVSATNQELIRIASLGSVIIGNNVEIGANTSIDRGTIVSTRIGNGTKIDNQVQIGHNVTIGDNCLICGRVGIAGSVTVGNRVVLGGAVGIADHVTIGDDAVAMAMSGIAGNVQARTIVGGLPAAPRERLMESMFNIARLKQFFKKIEALTLRIDALEGLNKKD